MPITTLALAAAENAVNKALSLDPFTAKRLAGLAGRVIAIHIDAPALDLFIIPDPHGVMLMSRYEGRPDLKLSGGIGAFARLAGQDRTQGKQGVPSGIGIEGDANLASQLQEIVAGLDLDWEEQLSRLTGDTIAHQTGRLVRGAAAYARETAGTLGMNLEEFLKEETRFLPQRFEVDEWVADVDRLRDDAARLEARVQRLEKSRTKA